MRGGLIFLTSILLLASFPAILHAQGKIQGTVSNGTTGQPVENQTLQLLLPRGGMQRVATVTTDATGRFVFPSANIDPASFYLVQASYGGVDYNAPAQFDPVGTANLSITVYDATSSAPPLGIQSARLVVHAQGNQGACAGDVCDQEYERPATQLCQPRRHVPFPFVCGRRPADRGRGRADEHAVATAGEPRARPRRIFPPVSAQARADCGDGCLRCGLQFEPSYLGRLVSLSD